MDEDRQKKGREMFEAVYGGITAIPEGSENDPFIELMLDNLFAKIWSREAMSIRDRRLVIIGIAAAMGEEFIFETQARAAITKGELNRDQIQEIVLLLTQYVGYPRASRLRARVQPLLAEAG
jgi:4-carboxymuconolactone decarboxylase